MEGCGMDEMRREEGLEGGQGLSNDGCLAGSMF